jgi:23S rRNA pseudouridine1911/1915/1917 synthase
MNEIITLKLEDINENTRIDKYLAEKLANKNFSREKIKKIILAGKLKLNGQIIRNPNYKIKNGQEISVENLAIERKELKKYEIELDIIFEDNDLIILNKQAGLVVHPGNGNQNNTLVNALIAKYGANLSSGSTADRPGIVHRLDKNTSGLMMIAKNDAAHLKISKQLAEKNIIRKYLAVTWGLIKPDQGVITKNIERNPRNRKLMHAVYNGGKRAVTHYKTKEIYMGGKLSLVECQLETGRTHQIRVHMSDIGHNLFGDPEYGHHGRKLNKYINMENKYLYNFKRQALHSYFLKFTHPINKEEMEFTIDIAPDMQELIRCLQEI